MKLSRCLVGLIAAVGIGSLALALEQAGAITGMNRAYKHGVGTYLVDDAGRTLYVRSGESAEGDGDWQPVLTGEQFRPGSGIDPELIGATNLDGERAQFTYGGLPLYTYAGDETTGDMRGHGLGGSSFAVSVTGEPLGANPAQFRAGPSTDRIDRAYKFGVGTYLVDALGFSLYAFTQGDDGSTCTGACAVNWPPLVAGPDVTVGSGLDSGLLGTIVREDGAEQLTYAGMPLYRFSGDDGVGSVAGHSEGDSWSLVGADGDLLSVAGSVEAAEPAESTPDEDAPGRADAQPDGEADERADDSESAEDAEEAVSDVPAALMTQGATVFSSGTSPSCASCHGAEGEGGAGPSLHDNSALANRERIIRTVLRGGHIMPAFGDQLTDERVAAVLTFVRNSWGNDFGVISTDEVNSIR